MITKGNRRIDYYAFGMQMPGRQTTSNLYRYGFNGKEKDDEVKGDGNSLDFGARIYDTRLGKFLSIDPRVKEIPWQGSYVFADNKPIRYIDVDGMGAGDRVKAAEAFVGKVTYSQAKGENLGLPLRTGHSEKALKYTDCSELVCRVLHADGITTKVEQHLARKNDLGVLLGDETKFEHSDDKPQVGDIALWDGHTGIVGGVDKNGNIQLIHAAGKGKGALKNKYAIKPEDYRSSTFYGYYRPKKETVDGKKSAEDVMKTTETDPVEPEPPKVKVKKNADTAKKKT